jgi:translocation and assembly module TamB
MARHKVLTRIAIAVVALIVVLTLAAFLTLRSNAFHRFVLSEVVTHADEATGGKVQIGDFEFNLSTLRVDLYRLAFFKSDPSLGRISLSVAHLGVKLKIISLLGAKLSLRQIDIDRPVVDFVSSTERRSNRPQGKQRAGNFSPFRLAIGRVILDQGEVYVNDRRIPVEARLLGLEAQAAFDALTKQYDGILAYRAGTVQLDNYQPLAHSLDLHFSANAEGVRAEPLVIRTADSSISVQASLKSYSQPVADGSYSATLASAEVARVLRSRVMKPAGEIRTSGAFAYRYTRDRTLLDCISLRGIVGSPRLSVRVPHARGQVLALSGHYSLDHGNLTVRGLGGAAFGGQLAADATITNLAGPLQGYLTASLHSLSVGALRAALPDNRWVKFPIDGSANASVQVSWRGALKGLRANCDGTLDGSISIQRPGEHVQAIPVGATLKAAYDARADVLTLEPAVFRTPHSQVQLSGKLGSHAALTFAGQSRDLHETDELVTGIRQFVGGPSSRMQPVGMSGTASFHGLVQGTLQRPSFTGEFSADNLHVEQAVFRQVQAHVALSNAQLALSQGHVQAAQGNATFHALADLRNWAYHASQPISVDLTANQMSLAALSSVAHLKYPVNGIVSAQISVHGTASHPTGSGTVRVAKAVAWNQPVPNVTMQFQGNGTTIQSVAFVQTPGGNLQANVAFDAGTQRYQGQITAPHINLGRIRLLKAYKVNGVATGSVRGQGTLKAPGLDAELSIPTLRLGQQTITGVSAQMTVANQVARLTLNSNLSGILAHATGTVNLAGDYEATLSLNTGTIEAGPLLSSYLPGGAQNIQCKTQLKALLHGPLKNPQRLQAQLQIPMLRLGYQSIRLSSVSAINASYQNGSLVFEPAEIKGTGTDFHFRASAPLKADGPLSGSLTGTVNLQDMQIFEPHWASSGQLDVNLAMEGTPSHPLIQGQAHVVNAALSPPNVPVGIQNVNGTIAFNSTRAQITQLTGQAGGGPVVVSGSVSYLHGMQFNLSVNADNVRLIYPQGVHDTLGARLRFLGTESDALLTGAVLINDVSLAPQFDMMTFTNQFNVVSTPAGPGTSRIKLNVLVNTTRELTVTSNQQGIGGSIGGAAALRVQGTIADPVVVGRVTLASGGSLLFNGERFAVETGTINFVNPVVTEPVLNVRLTTTVDQYDVTLNFTGPVDSLRTTYTSTPPLSAANIITLLISGQPTQTQGNSTLGAESVLASGLGLGSSRVLKLAGLSSLTIDPQVGGYQTNPGVNIAMQKQVTKNLFFTFSVNTSMSEDDTVQVQYKVSKRWSVEALRDPDGGYTLEIRSQKTF